MSKERFLRGVRQFFLVEGTFVISNEMTLVTIVNSWLKSVPLSNLEKGTGNCSI